MTTKSWPKGQDFVSSLKASPLGLALFRYQELYALVVLLRYVSEALNACKAGNP